MMWQQSAELTEHHFLPGVPHCPLLLIIGAPSIPVFPLFFFKSCSPESFCLLETGLIETNGPFEPIQGDYAGLVGMLISCLLTKCCKTTQSRSTWFAPRGLTAGNHVGVVVETEHEKRRISVGFYSHIRF